MKTILIYPNMQKDGVRDILPKVCGLFLEWGATVLLPEGVSGAPDGVRCLPIDECLKQADFAVTLGGDGTMLRIAEAAAAKSVPLLGVNLGNIGFMTELEPEELALMRGLMDGDYSLDSRMMLHVSVLRDGKELFSHDALNDVVVKGEAFHMLRIHIFCGNEAVTSFLGDGVIASSPTGTTAYGISAGGPVLEPKSENIVITPICAHAMQAKAFVFAPSHVLSLRAESPSDSPIALALDGGDQFELLPTDDIMIARSALVTRLVRVKGVSFYQILRHKL